MLLFCIFILIAIIGTNFGYRDGLYATEDDDVRVLNNETFQADVAGRGPSVVWVVEFYSSWCGHCANFAPIWKRVAVDYKDWRDVVVIAAIDCSQTVNMKTCRENNITTYPVMMMYPPVDTEIGRVQKIQTHKLELIKQQILEYMYENAAYSWPNLKPLKIIEDIWLLKKDSHKHVVVIFEENTSPVGTQVIIDVRDVATVLVQRMLQEDVVNYGISKFPGLFKVIHDSTYTLLAIGSKNVAEDRMAFVRVIRALAESSGDETSNGTEKTEVKPQPDDDRERSDSSGNTVIYNSSVVCMQDLESALHYSFRHEIAMRNTIDGEQFFALQNFVNVLVRYFPGRKPVKRFLKRVFRMLANLKSLSVTGAEWVNRINHLQDPHHFLPEVIKWEACQGSSLRYRGYPCSMWMLFHTLTVGAYTLSRHTRISSPFEVLLAIQDYMMHFFGCEECSRNFIVMARTLQEEVHSQQVSVLWLWGAHNRANERLHGDPSEDPKFPKIQFPSDDMCHNCRVLVPTGKGMTYSWNKKNVLAFLVNMYSEENIISSDSLPETFQVVNKTMVNTFVNVSVQNQEFGTFQVVNKTEANTFVNVSVQNQEFSYSNEMGDKRDLKLYLHSQGRKENDIKDHLPYLNSKQLKSRHAGNYFLQYFGLTNLDISVYAIFYVVCSVSMIILCYHFVVRRCKMSRNSKYL